MRSKGVDGAGGCLLEVFEARIRVNRIRGEGRYKHQNRCQQRANRQSI